MLTLVEDWKHQPTRNLVQFTYRELPYFAIHSTIADRILNPIELARVAEHKPKQVGKKLFSIGYEGISLETYLNKLIHQQVTLLCDVRKNAFSMKYGFSKKQLKYACEQSGIAYLHLPELGIDSAKRKSLNEQADYKALFHDYAQHTLPKNQEALAQVKHLFHKHDRIALTCFEKEVCMCHRGVVVQKLSEFPDWNIPVHHL